MGRTIVILPDELEKRFKEEIMKRYGMKRGNIKKAMVEAIKDWINKKVGR